MRSSTQIYKLPQKSNSHDANLEFWNNSIMFVVRTVFKQYHTVHGLAFDSTYLSVYLVVIL